MHYRLLTLLIVFSSGLFAEEVHKVSANGSATIYKVADKLTLVIGVETYDRDVKKATQANATKMKAVQASLLKTQLTEKEIQTKDFTVIPQLTPAPKNPPADWQPTLAGYQVRNTLEIRTDKVGLAAEIIDAAANEGSNIIQSISFALQDEEQAKIEAIGKAFHTAEAYAQAAAKAAGVQLGEVIDLSISHPFANAMFFKAERMAQDTATPITPREVEVTASVSVVYSIGKNN